MPKVDMSGIATELEVLPAGSYPVALEKFEEKTNNKGDGTYYSCMFSVTDGDYQGRKVFRNYSLKPDAMWAVKQLMIRLGTEPEELEGVVDTDEVMATLLGAQGIAVVIVKNGLDGTPQNDVRGIKAASDGAGTFDFS